MTTKNPMPFEPDQLKKLKRAFTEKPCDCPSCRLTRNEIPAPNETVTEVLAMLLELFKQHGQDIGYVNTLVWLSRAFMLGYAHGHAQSTGDSNDHQEA